MRKVICRKSGLTRIEVLVSVATLILLGGLFIPPCPKGKVRAQRINCVSNLKQVGLAFRLFSNDHHDKFPWRIPVSEGGTETIAMSDPTLQFLALGTNLPSPKILACPSDKLVVKAATFDKLSRRNVSYFVSLEAHEQRPQTLLSGDRNITGGVYSNGMYYLDAQFVSVGWGSDVHGSAGNIGLADGSAQQVTEQGLKRQLQSTTNKTVRLLVP